MGAVIGSTPSPRRLLAGCLTASWVAVFALTQVAAPRLGDDSRVAARHCCCADRIGAGTTCACCACPAHDSGGRERGSICRCELRRGGEQLPVQAPDRVLALATPVVVPWLDAQTPVTVARRTRPTTLGLSPPEPVPRSRTGHGAAPA